MKYLVKARVTKTWTAEETVEIPIEAESEEDACGFAEQDAERRSDIDHYDADLESVDIYIIKCDPFEGEEGVTILCDKTKDMFQ